MSISTEGQINGFVGKHARLWLDTVDGAQLLNDDNPILRITENGSVIASGSPWSGKTPCYKNKQGKLRAAVRLYQAEENRYKALSGIDAFAELLPSFMAGYTTVDAATGVPGSLTMNHLGGMVCFHLTCDDFILGQTINGIQFSDGSASPCCFPGSATVAVALDGAVTTTPVFTADWSASGSFIPYSNTANGVTGKCVDVYLSTFPTTIVGPLTVTLYMPIGVTRN